MNDNSDSPSRGNEIKHIVLSIGGLSLIAVCGAMTVLPMAGVLAYLYMPRPPQVQSYTVTYRVTGTATQVDVTYLNPDGTTQQETISVPWEHAYSTRGNHNAHLEVVNHGEGSIFCEIDAGGLDHTITEGQVDATCSSIFDISKNGTGGGEGGTMRDP